jgi:ribose transport system substrate-binding protein
MEPCLPSHYSITPILHSPMYFNQEEWLHPIDRTLQFTFIPKSLHPWYTVVKKGAERAIRDLHQWNIAVEMTWDAPIVPDMEVHRAKIQEHVEKRPDGLAIACLAPASEIPIVNEAVKAGVNVITFDTDAPHSLRQLYVGHSGDFQDGYDLAELLAKRIDYAGKVAILSGTLSAPNHLGRVRGFCDGIAQFKDIKIVIERADNDELEKALEHTEQILQNYPDIKGFFCCNASNPIGCARAVKNAGRADGVHIVGMDDMPETIQFIKDGVIDGIKMQRQWEIGYWSVLYMTALNQGHTVPGEHAIGSRILTKADL